MARKVFISFLGTGDYLECMYRMPDGLVSRPVRFVQEALIEYHCRHWTTADQIFIFCTSEASTGQRGSKEINWFDDGHARGEMGLKSCLQNLGLQVPVKEIDIKAGLSEEEIWHMFNTVYGELASEDEIYFDVTHAFRSIPLFSAVLFNYAKFMKDTRLACIQYGAFDKLGARQVVEKIPLDNRIAPIVDLTGIARLQEYTQIASELKNFGRVESITEVIGYGEGAEIHQAFVDLKRSILNLEDFITTIDLKRIKSGSFISTFRNNYNRLRKRGLIVGPVQDILDKLYQETRLFVERDDFQNVEAAIYWALNHDMLMQAYALTREYVICWIGDRHKDRKPDQMEDVQFNDLVKKVLTCKKDVLDARNWNSISEDYTDVVHDIAEDPLIKRIRPCYNRVRYARNSLVHSFGNISHDELRNKYSQDIEDCLYIIHNESRR